MRVVVFLDSIDELIGRVIVVWTLIMSNEVRVVVFLDSIDEWTAESQCFFYLSLIIVEKNLPTVQCVYISMN